MRFRCSRQRKSNSALGVIALCVLILAVLAWIWWNQSPEVVREFLVLVAVALVATLCFWVSGPPSHCIQCGQKLTSTARWQNAQGDWHTDTHFCQECLEEKLAENR